MQPVELDGDVPTKSENIFLFNYVFNIQYTSSGVLSSTVHSGVKLYVYVT